METKQKCPQQVSDSYGFHLHPCGRPVFEGGKCKIHCDSAVAARRAKSAALWEAKNASSHLALLTKCRAERDRLIERNKVLREALEAIVSDIGECAGKGTDGYVSIYTRARAALAQED